MFIFPVLCIGGWAQEESVLSSFNRPLYSTADILSCHSRKGTGVAHDIMMPQFNWSVLASRDSMKNLKLKWLNGVQPLLMLFFILVLSRYDFSKCLKSWNGNRVNSRTQLPSSDSLRASSLRGTFCGCRIGHGVHRFTHTLLFVWVCVSGRGDEGEWGWSLSLHGCQLHGLSEWHSQTRPSLTLCFLSCTHKHTRAHTHTHTHMQS